MDQGVDVEWQAFDTSQKSFVGASGINKDGGADEEADEVDGEVLGSLGVEALGTGIGKGPVAVEDEVARDGGGEGEGLGGDGGHAELGVEEVEGGEIDNCADSADGGEAQEAGALAGVGE